MNVPTKILLTLFALGSVGGAGYYFLEGLGTGSSYGISEDGTVVDTMDQDEESMGAVGTAGEEDGIDDPDSGRQSLSVEMDGEISDSGPAAIAKLEVEGRVLSKDGRPVQNAHVDVYSRKSYDFRQTMRRGNWREAMSSPEARNWMSRRGDYKPKQIGKDLLTDAEGRFAMDAETFASADVEVSVQHDIYAPVVVERQWRAEDGKLVLEKIEVEMGGKIIGTVLSKTGGAVAKAKITWNQRNQGRRGRGGRGRGFMGRGGSERLKQLMGDIETNQVGQFEIKNAPPGDFSISVDAEDFIPNRSKNLKLDPGAIADTGIVYLERGAVLSGIVRNKQGVPVAGARVSATVSQEYVRKQLTELLKARGLGDINSVWRDEKARNDPQVSYLLGLMSGGGRGNRGGRGRGMMGRFGGNRSSNEVQTDKLGKFTLTRLAHAPLEVQVRHGDYLDEDKKGVDPDKTPKLDILVEKRLSLSGVVLNATTGEGLGKYSIRARSIQARDLPESIRQAFGVAAQNDPRRGNRGRNSGLPSRGNRNRDSGLPSRGNNRGNRGNRNGGNRNGSNRNGGNRNAGNRNAGNRNAGNRNGNQRAPQQLTPDQLRRKAAQEKKQAERRAKQAAQEQKRQLDQARRNAERTARNRERDRQKLQSFGNSGVPFRGSNAKQETHEAGAFRLDRLNPGLYVLDIEAPGFRKIAAGPYQLAKGVPPPKVTIRLQRGRFIEGKVATRRGKVIAGADVELFIPPTNTGQANANQGNFMANLFRRGQNNGTRLDRVRTDGEGKFRFEGQSNGTYRLVVRADGYASFTQEALQVSGRDVTGLSVKLARGGKIFGKVLNMPEGERVTVTINSDNGTRRNARVDADTGEYSEINLDPGKYIVRLMKGRNFMGGVMSALAQPGGIQPNVVLGEGEQRRFDLDAGTEELGKIEGLVYLNGAPVGGLSIRLDPIEGQGGINKEALQGMGRMRRFLGRMFQARTNKEGKYSLDNIPPGNYDLSIRKRIKGSEKVVHKEVARIIAGGPQHLNYSLILGKLKLTVKDQDGKNAGRVRILLALSSEAGALPPQEWRKLPSFQRADIRGGKLTLVDLKVGEYQYYLSGRQLTPRRDRLFVAAPPAPSEVRIQVKKKAPTKKAVPKKPSNNVLPGTKK